jgi:hypothetical protein
MYESSMSRHRLARALVQLYPHKWRERYATEVLALVDDTGLGFARAIDLGWGAGREWGRTIGDAPLAMFVAMFIVPMILGSGLAFLGTLAAQWLTAHVPTPAVVWIEDGQKVVQPPRLPGNLGLSGPLLQMLLLARVILAGGFFSIHWKWKIRPVEAFAWLVALLVTSVFQQWFRMVAWYETGVPAEPVFEIWLYAALPMWTAAMWLVYSSRYVSNQVEQHRLRREAARADRRGAVPRGPLGLT